MSLIFELQELKFLLNSGIDTFYHDKPNSKYRVLSKEKEFIETKIIENISEISTLNKLKEFIENSNICNLKKNAKRTVFADGNSSSKIMLIGEAPGAEEDKYGIPFVGKAGELLNKMLASIGLSRKHVYISNIIPWRPNENREPTTEEILQCLPFIQRHIELINPSILILLGGTASKALLTSNKGISKLRGVWHKYISIGLSKHIIARPIFHPAFLLRSPEYKKVTWQDLIEVKKRIELDEIK